MGDSTAMTIEFLRARLLSERAISKAVKEKADQLAKRVTELEEQVKIMAFQRRKTERAAIEAISILESHGMNDLSDAVDSSSNDDETPSGEKSREGNDGEVHPTAKSVIIVLEDAQSSSEVEVSPSRVGSLVWKGHCKNPNSAKKLKGRQFKQSQRQINLGSCRKIKQDVGSTSEDKVDDYVIVGDDQPELSINASGSQSSFEIIQKKEAGAFGSERDEEMEIILEQQAQLIGQYEAEEKAQREWEKKYNENKSSNQVFSEPENQCHEPEANCESQKDSFACFEKIPCEDKEKSDIGVPSVMKEPEFLSDPLHDTPDDALKKKLARDRDAKIVEFSNGHIPTDLPRMGSESSSQAPIHGLIGKVTQHMAVAQSQPSMEISDTFASLAAVSFPAKNCPISSSYGKKNKGLIYENSKCQPVNNNNISSRGHTNSSSIGYPSTFNSRKEALKVEMPRTPTPSCTRSYQLAGSRPGGVLESLQRAKISLKQELHRLSSLGGQGNNNLPATSTHHIPRTISGESSKAPPGSAGLFRLPSDTFPLAQKSEQKFHGSGSHFATGFPCLQYATTPGDYHHRNIPYVEARSSNSINNNHRAGHTDSIRYSLPFTGMATDRISLPNETGVSIRNRDFETHFQEVKNPSSRQFSMHSTPMTDAASFPSGSETSLKQYPGPFYPRFEMPPPMRYSLPYSDTTRWRHGASSTRPTDARTRMQSQDQFLYGGHETHSNMQML